ncbi:MAG: hypothetical protein R3A44_18430 [Caldilineaceae bacterium]
MTSLEKLQQTIDALLMDDLNRASLSAQQRLFGVPKQGLGQPFHPFGKEDTMRAHRKVVEWQNLLVREQREQGLYLLHESILDTRKKHGTAFVKSTLMSFIVHNGADVGLTLPHFLQRHSHLAKRRSKRWVTSCEDVLSWFREDLFLNEHHEHWHNVYGAGTAKEDLKDREGELFLYMHQQMLARYNTERIAVNLPMIEPFPTCEFGEQIALGYDPGLDEYGVRYPNTSLLCSTLVDEESIEKKYNQPNNLLRRAIASGKFGYENKPFTDEANLDDVLGHTMIGNKRSANWAKYGDLHENFHDHAADITKPPGVLGQREASANDPLFYQWHRYLDNLAYEFQNTQEPNNISADAPDVLIRSNYPHANAQVSQSQDILLCLQSQLDCLRKDGKTDEALGKCLFGGANWCTDFTDTLGLTTSQLFTKMEELAVTVDGAATTFNFLTLAEDFTYFIRVQNLQNSAQCVTVRIWLVAKYERQHVPLYNDRRMWIELDTFREHLCAYEKKVICRPSHLSSVVRKSAGVALTPQQWFDALNDPAKQQNAEGYCDCGWPYSLLLPRGTKAGMDFRLMVMFTSGDDVAPEATENQCGSVRLCGVKGGDYPDKKRMGYPFNRPLPVGQDIETTIAIQRNMAARDIRVVCLP